MSSSETSVLPVGARLAVEPARAGPTSPSFNPAKTFDVAIVGAGVIGLSIGWRLARRGLATIVFDRATAGSGTSLAATGMLAAAAEHEAGGDDLLALALESQRTWPDFAAALEADSGLSIDYRDEGTLILALGRDEVARLRFRYEQQCRAGLRTAAWLNGAEVREREPGLRPSVAAGLYCPDDHQIDPRLMMPALCRAYLAAGGELVENCQVDHLDRRGGQVAGLFTAAGPCKARKVVLAAGAWTGEGDLLPAGLRVPVRPLKGQALALRTNPATGTLSHIIWTEQVHLAPKADGRLILGATMEECGFDESVSAGGLYALLEGARRALPSVEEMRIEAIWSGFRPTSDDDAPILGACAIDGLIIATGHHRNGFLLAPVTAQAIEDVILRGAMKGAARAFGIGRFDAAATGSAARLETDNADHRQWAAT
jgi:glycine oxidase